MDQLLTKLSSHQNSNSINPDIHINVVLLNIQYLNINSYNLTLYMIIETTHNYASTLNLLLIILKISFQYYKSLY